MTEQLFRVSMRHKKTDEKISLYVWASKVDEDDPWVVGLDPNGDLDGNRCTSIQGSRPAFLIPSTLTVEIDGEEDQEGQEAPNPLEQYTSKELAAELLRRMTE